MFDVPKVVLYVVLYSVLDGVLIVGLKVILDIVLDVVIDDRGLPKPPKPGTYQEPGNVKFSKTRNRNLPGSSKT